MASARSLSRLYPPVKNDNLSHLEEPVKCPNFGQSDPEVSMLDMQRAAWSQPVRGRFGRGFESAAVAPPDLMSAMAPDTSPDHAGRFRALAAQDRAAHLLRRLAVRGWQGFPAPPV